MTAHADDRRLLANLADARQLQCAWPKDVVLSEALADADAALNTRCGGKSICDGCLVQLRAGQVRCRDTGVIHHAPAKVRACECITAGDQPVTIDVPQRSLLSHRPQIVSQFKINIPFAQDPLSARPGGDLGVAVDVGTTTVATLLVELKTGKVLAKASEFNQQARLGDNVLTRINLCRTEERALHRLQQAINHLTLRPLIQQMLKHAEVPAERIGVISVAGNTTMQHLVAGINPGPMGEAPFPPAFVEHRVEDGSLIADWLRNAPLHLLPSAAAYVGADLCAGMLATGMVYEDGPVMLIDMGTNGEIILKAGDHLLGCATAMGPAFEGAGLQFGSRATDGAISHAGFRTHPFAVEVEKIGAADVPALGICGSAYIDLLAEGRRTGLLNAAGRIPPEQQAALDGLLRDNGSKGKALVLAPGKEADQPIMLSEADIAQLLQAKAAVAAGIELLLQRVGLTTADVKTAYLAGGFGLHLRIPNAIACGLLPGFQPHQVKLVGNTSLGGAYLALLDQQLLNEMKRHAEQLEIIELNLDPNFELSYIEQLSLP